MQIGPVKYSKKEEEIFFKSFLLGLLVGLPVGVVLYYLLGFPGLPKQLPSNFGGWFIFLFIAMTGSCNLWFLATVILYFFFYKRAGLLNSWRDFLKIVWSIFIFLPVCLTYTVFTTSAVLIPLYSAAPWLSPVKQYWLGLLLTLGPFLALFAAVFLPESPARKGVLRLWLILKGEASIPKINARSLVVSLLILFWLVLVFLPLPDTPGVNLTLIASGLLIVAYLAKQRYQKKEVNDVLAHAFLVSEISGTCGLFKAGLEKLIDFLTAIARKFLQEISYIMNSFWARGLKFFDITGIFFTLIDFAFAALYLKQFVILVT